MPHKKGMEESYEGDNPGLVKGIVSDRDDERKSKSKGHEISRVSIEPAENGYIVECNYKPKNESQKGEPAPAYIEPVKKVFESAEGALAFLREKL